MALKIGLRVAFAALLGFVPNVALADACMDEVREVFQTHLNAFERPPFRSERIHFSPDGVKISGFTNVVQSPLRGISLVHGDIAALSVDQQLWVGPTVDGPWTISPDMLPADRLASMESGFKQELANLVEPECNGMVERDGKTYLNYVYTTKTDPEEAQGGLWFGATNSVFLDPETKLVMIWEQTDFISSFSSKSNPEKSVETFVYDETITVDPPQ